MTLKIDSETDREGLHRIHFQCGLTIFKSRNYRVNTLSGREVCLFSLKTNTHTLPLILSFEVYCAARGRPALILLMQPNYLCNSKY